MPKTIYHLRFKSSNEQPLTEWDGNLEIKVSLPNVPGRDFYFASLKALVDLNKNDLGVGIDTLYRHPWTEAPYENKLIIIKKGILEVPPRKKKKIKK